MANKFAHIRGAKLDPSNCHSCAWPECKVQVPRQHYMCLEHWFAVPKQLRDRVWSAYELGQEDALELVSEQYIDATSAVQSWVRSYLAATR